MTEKDNAKALGQNESEQVIRKSWPTASMGQLKPIHEQKNNNNGIPRPSTSTRTGEPWPTETAAGDVGAEGRAGEAAAPVTAVK